MADAANKYPENVDGKFYVDDQCIDCDLCRETAPANFRRNDDGGHSYVYKQPESPEEEALCKEAMEGCPVEAIGRDRKSTRLNSSHDQISYAVFCLKKKKKISKTKT